jgi:hypothetical protein
MHNHASKCVLFLAGVHQCRLPQRIHPWTGWLIERLNLVEWSCSRTWASRHGRKFGFQCRTLMSCLFAIYQSCVGLGPFLEHRSPSAGTSLDVEASRSYWRVDWPIVIQGSKLGGRAGSDQAHKPVLKCHPEREIVRDDRFLSSGYHHNDLTHPVKCINCILKRPMPTIWERRLGLPTQMAFKSTRSARLSRSFAMCCLSNVAQATLHLVHGYVQFTGIASQIPYDAADRLSKFGLLQTWLQF